MKVKIGNTIYDPAKEPVLLILDPIDKLNIMAMKPEANIYVSHPKAMPLEEVKKFMDLGAPMVEAAKPLEAVKPLEEGK